MSSEVAAVASSSAAVVAPALVAAEEPIETLEEGVVRQVEFYLSDSNLPFDKFLFGVWSQSFHTPSPIVTNTPVPADYVLPASAVSNRSSHSPFHLGWLPLERLTSFKRMQPFLAAPPAGLGSLDAIAEVLNANATLVEARRFGTEGEDGAGWFVRRTTELCRPEDAMGRSIYIKGFAPSEVEASTEEEKRAELDIQKRLEAWVRATAVGQMKSLRMRRELGKPLPGKTIGAAGRGKFKGSIFVEFSSADAVAAFLALDPAPTFEGLPLTIKSKSAYVEEKRAIYAPGSKAPEASALPKQPYSKSAKPFNAWAEKLVGAQGFPELPPAMGERRADGKKDNKRKASDGPEERDILFDGVKFTARRTGGEGSEVEIINKATIGLGEGGWAGSKVMRMTISKKDGTVDGDVETGEFFNFGSFKQTLTPVCKPAFVSLFSSRPIAALPVAATTTAASYTMAVDTAPTASGSLTAPPTIGSAADIVPEPVVAVAEPAKSDDNDRNKPQEYPALGQASFRDPVTEEILAQLRSEVGTWSGRKVTWTRASEVDERAHVLSRAQFHAEQAFSSDRGAGGGRGGGRGGRGGDRGGRGGRGGGDRGRGGRGGGRGGGGRGGDRAKRPRTD